MIVAVRCQHESLREFAAFEAALADAKQVQGPRPYRARHFARVIQAPGNHGRAEKVSRDAPPEARDR